MCVCFEYAEVIWSFTPHCCGEVQSDTEKMLRAQVISQQNTRTVDVKT